MVSMLLLCSSLTLILLLSVRSLMIRVDDDFNSHSKIDKLIPIQAAAMARANYTGLMRAKTRALSEVSDGQVMFVTVETRDIERDHVLLGSPTWSWTVLNLGAGLTWEGFTTKLDALRAFVDTLPDDQLVTVLDGGDVMYGGCDMDFFQQRYKNVSAFLGAPIIYSVEMNCFQAPNEWCLRSNANPNRTKLLDELLHIEVTDQDSWNEAEGDYENDGCQLPSCGHLSYLNAGFYMGPAKYLRELYRLMTFVADWSYDDQGWAWTIWEANPELVGIDYTASLSTSLYHLRTDIFEFESFQWLNSETSEPVCFFHGNGASKGKLRTFDARLGNKTSEKRIPYMKVLKTPPMMVSLQDV